MNECERMSEELKAYVDGQLSPVARIALRLHLNGCASCRREIEEMRQLGKRMRADDALEMTDALRARILAAVPSSAPGDTMPMLPKWRQKPVLLWGGTAAAAVLWFALYPLMSRYPHSPGSGDRLQGLTGGSYTQDFDEKPIPPSAASSTYKDSAGEQRQSGVVNGKAQAANAAGYESFMTHEKTETDPAKSSQLEMYHVTQSRIAVGAGGDVNGSLRGSREPATADVGRSVVTQLHVARHAAMSPSPKALAKGDGANQNVVSLADEDVPTERQVHREASLTLEVANTEQQSESVERLVKESKGYVAQNQLTTGEDNTRTASLTCKVPVDQFETVMSQISRLGKLKAKSLTGEDITEKVSDAQETGHVLRADIAITEEKLKERRGRVQTLRDEETLRQLRIRSAQAQARLKMLNRLGALAEIVVELNEKPLKSTVAAPKPVSPFMEEISGTGQAAAHSFLMALRLPLQLLVWIVVYAPIWALILIAYRRFTR